MVYGEPTHSGAACKLRISIQLGRLVASAITVSSILLLLIRILWVGILFSWLVSRGSPVLKNSFFTQFFLGGGEMPFVFSLKYMNNNSKAD